MDSLGELGVVGEAIGELELDEDAPPAAPVLLAPVPVVELLLDASAPGAGVGVVVVVVDDDDDGAVGAAAGGGVVTVVSSFLLQAARPTTTRAAIRSERFMFFSSRRYITRV